jgi:hypothetical protein
VEVRVKAPALAVAAAVLLLAASPRAFQSTAGEPVEKAFPQGGRIRLNLSASEYKISGQAADKIRIAWRADKAEDAAGLRADVSVTGTSAVIATSGFKGNGLHFTIELPARSDIDVSLAAGDLDIHRIEGSKTIDAWAGDVSVDVGNPDQYRDVQASVRAGDLSAPPFKVATGGLLRSLKWTGQGRYSLHIKLFAGDLTLR